MAKFKVNSQKDTEINLVRTFRVHTGCKKLIITTLNQG